MAEREMTAAEMRDACVAMVLKCAGKLDGTIPCRRRPYEVENAVLRGALWAVANVLAALPTTKEEPGHGA